MSQTDTKATHTMTVKQTDTDYHEGRPVIRSAADGGVLVLCPLGHLYRSMPAREWAGSWLEAKVGDASWTIRCHGTMPKGGPHADDEKARAYMRDNGFESMTFGVDNEVRRVIKADEGESEA